MSIQTGNRLLDSAAERVRTLSEAVAAIESRGIPLGRLNGVFILLVLWVALASQTPAQVMPMPGELVSITWELFREGVVMKHLVATFNRTLWGFLGALAKDEAKARRRPFLTSDSAAGGVQSAVRL